MVDYKTIYNDFERAFGNITGNSRTSNTKSSYADRFKRGADNIYKAAESFYCNNGINEGQLKDLANSYNSRFLEYVDNVNQGKKKNLVSAKPKYYGKKANLENILDNFENKKITNGKNSDRIKYINDQVEGANKALKYSIQGNEIAEIWFILKNEKKYVDKMSKVHEKISKIKKNRGFYEHEKKDIKEHVDKIFNQYIEKNKIKNKDNSKYVDSVIKQKKYIDNLLKDKKDEEVNNLTLDFLGLEQTGEHIKNFYDSAKKSIKQYFSRKEEKNNNNGKDNSKANTSNPTEPKNSWVRNTIAGAAITGMLFFGYMVSSGQNGGGDEKPYEDAVFASEAPDSIKSFPYFTPKENVKPPVDELKKNPHKIKEANDEGKLWFSLIDENRQDKSSITPGYNKNLIPDDLEGKMTFYHNDGSGWQKVDKPGQQNLETGQLILGYVKDGKLYSKASLVVDDYVAPEPTPEPTPEPEPEPEPEPKPEREEPEEPKDPFNGDNGNQNNPEVDK